MNIKNVEIQNFRSLKDINLSLENLTVILGRNGAGKSSILYALDAFYDVNKSFDDFDYFAKDDKLAIKIKLTFCNLTKKEKTAFEKYIQNDEFSVTKIITKGGVKYIGVIKQLEEFSKFREMSATECRSNFNKLVDSKIYEDLNEKAKSQGDALDKMGAFEEAHPELLKPIESQTQFLGPKNIGGGSLDNYTKFVLVPAVKNVLDETTGKGVVLQLIDILVMRSINSREDIAKKIQEIEQVLKETYSTDNIPELKQLAEVINNILVQYAPDALIDLDFEEIQPPKIKAPNTLVTVIDEKMKLPVSHVGHGLQRALVIALLHQLALVVENKEDKKEGENKIISEAKVILAIEEPELYLHPSRCRFLSSVLNKLANMEDGPSVQVICATHSPYFVDIGNFERIRVARKTSCDDYEVNQTEITQYSRNEANNELASLYGLDIDKLTPETFSARAMTVMTVSMNEGFFADVVVVVEGFTEFGIFWALQDCLGKKWDEKNIVIVPALGKTKIDWPVIIFNGLSIPTYYIFDADSDAKGDDLENAKKFNKIYTKLGGIEEEELPGTKVMDNFAVFNTKIEDELSKVNENYYEETRTYIAKELGYAPSEILKNPEGSSRFIYKAYKEGVTYSVLKSIVDKISELI